MRTASQVLKARLWRLPLAVVALLTPGSALPGLARGSGNGTAPGDLRCEYLQDPLGIDVARPRLGWTLDFEQRGRHQVAYQVLVARSADDLARDHGDLWDSGRVPSGESLQIEYMGMPLNSGQQCFWKVRAWGAPPGAAGDGESNAKSLPSAWSDVATWTMGVLEPADWAARWIAASEQAEPTAPPAKKGRGPGKPETAPATEPATLSAATEGSRPPLKSLPLFRREFEVTKPFSRAVIHVCGLGQFELHINGEKVGDDVLQPGWTDYRKTCLYVTYDVTGKLRQARNALGVMLGNGMYHVAAGSRYTKFHGSFGPLKLIAQLCIDYKDGTRERVVTDEWWKVAAGPVTYSNVYGGEDYDARLEQAGWDAPGFDDAAWLPALETEGPGGRLAGSSRSAPAIRVREVFTPREVTEPQPGVWVCDLGQNCAMMPHIVVAGPAGAQVRLTPGELLKPDGTVSQATSGGPAYFTYTLKGRGHESWAPRFTYYGCRYLQVVGVRAALARAGATTQPGTSAAEAAPDPAAAAGTAAAAAADASGPDVLTLEGRFISSSDGAAGEFSCSNDLFNHTAGIIRWAMRSNMVSVLTDCPHRERLGWLEQDHLVGPSLMYNYDVAVMYTKVCRDIADAQHDDGMVPEIAPEYVKFSGGFLESPEWGSACVLVPWQLYEWYGDVSVLREQYGAMRRYVDYLGTRAKGHVVSFGLGDWFDLGPKKPGFAQLTPPALTATAFYYRDVTVLERAARLLGKAEDADAYRKLGAEIRESFNEAMYDPKTHEYATGSQTANAIPLVFGLVPPEDAPAVLENLVQDVRRHDNGLTAGDVGYCYLLRALADGGRSDVIFDMNSRSDRPGYGCILAKGATALTEAWNGGNSQDHFMLGHIMEWFYGDLAGIGPVTMGPRDTAGSEDAGFRKVLIKPTPVGDVTWAQASYDSVRGRIASRWTRGEGTFTLDVTVPTGATATVYLPASKNARVTEGGRPLAEAEGVKALPPAAGAVVCQILSGRYHFEVRE